MHGCFGKVLSAALLMAAWLMVGSAHAGYKILQRDGSANTVTAAKVLVAPSENDMSLTIRRIRVTNSASSTDPSYRFFSKLSALQEGSTESLASCILPACIEIAAVEAVQEGDPYDLDGLDIRLLPGDRLFFFASADISGESEYVTIEVWYDEGVDGNPLKRSRRR